MSATFTFARDDLEYSAELAFSLDAKDKFNLHRLATEQRLVGAKLEGTEIFARGSGRDWRIGGARHRDSRPGRVGAKNGVGHDELAAPPVEQRHEKQVTLVRFDGLVAVAFGEAIAEK